jgi:hypothetical protein
MLNNGDVVQSKSYNVSINYHTLDKDDEFSESQVLNFFKMFKN